MARKKFKSKVKLYVKISSTEVILLEKTFDLLAKDIELATDAMFSMVKEKPLEIFDDTDIDDFIIDNYPKNSKLLCEVKEVKRNGKTRY